MLMQMKNTERMSLTLQRATFLGSAIVRPTPQMKDMKQKIYGAATCKCSGAYQPKNPNQHPRLRLLARLKGPAPAQEDTATGPELVTIAGLGG